MVLGVPILKHFRVLFKEKNKCSESNGLISFKIGITAKTFILSGEATLPFQFCLRLVFKS